MRYIKNEDYIYIVNKYHDTIPTHDTDADISNLTFNTSGLGTDRFRCQTHLFDVKTGLSPEDIVRGISENDTKYSNAPHSIRKARALEFVLDNTRISCDIRDRFPAICSIDRPINKTLIALWKNEVFSELIPEAEAKRAKMERSGAVTIWPDFDHSVPVWDRIFGLGIKGLLDASELARIEYNKNNTPTLESTSFYDSINIEYSAIIRLIKRLSELAKTQNPRMADALSNISQNPPQSLYEALLLDYIFFMICEHIEGLQVRSLSNIDRLLYPFYKKDLENGISDEELRTDLAYFLLQFSAIGNYWGQPVYLGGLNAQGKSEINPFSYMFLDVYDKMGIYNPKIQIKFSKKTPKDFLCKALEMIRGGNNSIVFVCEETLIKSLMENKGASWDDARQCVISGCYEYSLQGSMDVGMNYFNLMKPLEYTISGGYDGVTGEPAGLKTSTDFSYFEDFYNTYIKQLSKLIDDTIEVSNIIDDYLTLINPLPMLSATFAQSIKKGKEPFLGGCISSNTDILFGFLANIADSLTAIKELVFDKKEYTIAELKEILDNNYEGHEALRQRILNEIDHYGNNKEIPDTFAKSISDYVRNYTTGRPNAKNRGGVWGCGFHVARMSYDQGKITAASPDGRLFGEELAKNVSASMGRNRDGVTAAILSATKLNASSFTSDECLDLGIHPTAINGDDGLEVMYALLITFEMRGGHAMHINVFSADTLREAQKNPEKYQDLQIRVCGWNVLFNNINKPEQDEFIRQAEALI